MLMKELNLILKFLYVPITPFDCCVCDQRWVCGKIMVWINYGCCVFVLIGNVDKKKLNFFNLSWVLIEIEDQFDQG